MKVPMYKSLDIRSKKDEKEEAGVVAIRRT